MSLSWSLSLAGITHRPLRWLLLITGVAVATMLPVAAAGIGSAARAAAVSQAVMELPSDQRTLTAITSRSPDPAVAEAVNGPVTAAFATFSPDPVERVLMYRQLSVDGSTFTLGGTTRLAEDITLTSGRMPMSCTPTRCEVIATVAQSGSAAGQQPRPADYAAAAGQLGLVVTGSGVLVDDHLFSGGLATDDQPVLLGASPTQIAELGTLQLFGRNNAWIVPLDPARILEIGTAAFAAQVVAFTDRINEAVGGVIITWPQDTVDRAGARAALSTHRFALLGATSSVIMLGFVLVASIGLRRRHQLLVRVMTRRGAPNRVIIGVPAFQVAICTVAGLAVGLGLGALAAAWQASGVSGAPHDVAGSAIAGSWTSVVPLGVAVILVALAAMLWPDRNASSVRLVTDLITVAGAAATALVLSGGTEAADPSGGGGSLVNGVAALVAVTTGLVAARVWPPVMMVLRRPLARWTGTTGLIGNLAVLGGVRRPLRPTVTAGFVAAAITALVFAGAYSATLRQSASDQASYQVPLDVRITSSATVSAPSTVVDPPAIMTAAPGSAVFPVVTTATEAFAGTQNAVGLPLIGLDPAAITSMHNFAHTTGSAISAGRLTTELSAVHAPAPAPTGALVPATTHLVHIAGSGGSVDYDLALWVVTESGSEQQIALLPVAGGFDGTPAGLPVKAGRLRVIAVEVTESSYHLVHRQHTLGEGNTDLALASGVITLGSVTVDGRPLQWSWRGWGSDQAKVQATPTSLRLAFQINDTRIIALPAFSPASTISALRVAVDPQTAAQAHGGTIALTIGSLSVPGQIVAVLPRMPTFGDRFVVADRSAVTPLLNRLQPGTAAVSQVWIQVPAAAQSKMDAYLRTYPINGTTVTMRGQAEDRLARDPVTTGSESLLTFAAVLALAMAMIALISAVWADRSDEAGEYLAWESDGLTPWSIRTVIFVRVCSVLLVGLPLGLAGGLFLAGTAAVLVAIGGSGYVPQPPVQLVVGAGATLSLLVVALVVSLAGAGLAATFSLRESVPPLPEVDLR